jgi:hypothetical protein
MGKRGRPAGSKNKVNSTEKVVASFEATKDDGLTVFTKQERHLIDKETIEKFDIKPVKRTSDISGRIQSFTGKNYEESLKLAYAWMELYNRRSTDGTKIKLNNYYPQVFMEKSILVGYDLKREKNVSG